MNHRVALLLLLSVLFWHSNALAQEQQCDECFGSGQAGMEADCPGSWDNECPSDPGPCYVNLKRCYAPYEDIGLFYVEADFMPLQRAVGKTVYQMFLSNLAAVSPAAGANRRITVGQGTDALTSDDLGDDFVSGMRLGAGVRLNETFRLEASYFGAHSWECTASVRNVSPNGLGANGNLLGPFGGFQSVLVDPTLEFDFNTDASISFSSRLHNGDISIYHALPVCGCRWRVHGIYGGRYMNIRETFVYASTSGTNDLDNNGVLDGTFLRNAVGVQTANDLYGPQIGSLIQFQLRDRVWMDFESKIAFLHNSADLNRQFIQQINLVDNINTTFAADRSRLAFAGDLSLLMRMQLTQWAIADIGYQATFVDGVALAQENAIAPRTELVNGPAVADASGDVIYHGPRIGLRLTW